MAPDRPPLSKYRGAVDEIGRGFRREECGPERATPCRWRATGRATRGATSRGSVERQVITEICVKEDSPEHGLPMLPRARRPRRKRVRSPPTRYAWPAGRAQRLPLSSHAFASAKQPSTAGSTGAPRPPARGPELVRVFVFPQRSHAQVGSEVDSPPGARRSAGSSSRSPSSPKASSMSLRAPLSFVLSLATVSYTHLTLPTILLV